MELDNSFSHMQETTPLISSKKRTTPLPKLQLFLLLWIHLTEPLTFMVIQPFINQLISELPITGGDEERTGYYAGLIQSLFFVTEALTVLQWSRLSDHIGRRPVLLMGLCGISLSMVLFGMSRSYWVLVFSRCLAGLLNGNVGVIRSMMGEITDSTNIAQGMAMMPVIWTLGGTVGSVVGGVLSNPYDRFPNTFGRYEFWRIYPYALPSFVIAGYCIFSWFLAYMYLEETVNPRCPPDSDDSRDRGALQDGPLSIREILTSRVITVIINCSSIAFLDVCFCCLQTLFYSVSIPNGGLELPPPAIGLCLGAFGLLNGVYQGFVFAPLRNRFGTKKIFVMSMAVFIPLFLSYPVMTWTAKHRGVGGWTWFEMAVQIFLYVNMDMGFSSAFIYVRAAAPSDASLGATNGLAQTSISIVRAIGPITANSLFALSLERDLLGGWLVYYVLVGVSVLALIPTAWLPRTLWNLEEPDIDLCSEYSAE